MRKAINILTTIVLILVLIFAFLLIGVRLFGLEPYTVLSGSMEPEYHVGSLIYVKKASADELQVGVPITYKMSNGVVVTHRIIEVIEVGSDPSDISYRTKGDANEDADGTPVHYSKVIGRPVFTVPLIGYVCYFVQNPPGLFITVGVLIMFVILAFLPELFALAGAADRTAAAGGSDETERLNAELLRLKAELETKSAGSAAPSSEEERGTETDGTDPS